MAGESLAGAALAYLATASPELAALEASLCASMAVARVMLRPTLASCFGTSRLQYRLEPCLTNVVSERRTPHSTHLKQPLWKLAPSTSTLSIGYAVLPHAGHALFRPPNREDTALGIVLTWGFVDAPAVALDVFAAAAPAAAPFVSKFTAFVSPAVRPPSPNACP